MNNIKKTTLTDNLAEILFPAEGLSFDSKLDALKMLCNGNLNAAAVRITLTIEKIEAGQIDSFALDALAEDKAKLTVWSEIAYIIWNRMNPKGLDEAEVITIITQHARDAATMRFRINSTSNMHVELELRVKEAWGDAVDRLKWL